MIVASAVLLVVGLVTFVLGLLQEGPNLIYASIASSVGALVTLFVGVRRDRATTPPSAPALEEPPTETFGVVAGSTVPEPAVPTLGGEPIDDDAPAPLMMVAEDDDLDDDDDLEDDDDLDDEGPTLAMPAEESAAVRAARAAEMRRTREVASEPAPRKTATRKPATRKTTTRKSTAKKTTTRKPAARKSTAKKTTTRKTTTRKSTAKKTTTRKPAARKSTTRKK